MDRITLRFSCFFLSPCFRCMDHWKIIYFLLSSLHCERRRWRTSKRESEWQRTSQEQYVIAREREREREQSRGNFVLDNVSPCAGTRFVHCSLYFVSEDRVYQWTGCKRGRERGKNVRCTWVGGKRERERGKNIDQWGYFICGQCNIARCTLIQDNEITFILCAK